MGTGLCGCGTDGLNSGEAREFEKDPVIKNWGVSSEAFNEFLNGDFHVGSVPVPLIISRIASHHGSCPGCPAYCNWPVSPDHSIDELQKVKAEIPKMMAVDLSSPIYCSVLFRSVLGRDDYAAEVSAI